MTKLPVGLLAQLVEPDSVSVSQRSWIRILFKPDLFFFSDLLFASCSSSVHNCDGLLYLLLLFQIMRILWDPRFFRKTM